ncbi:MAG TPA: SgcJ/EcaC family oxidoreductase [Pyrinomonadaceae bacterium]|jgi:uncharacterized protein (TIGR02246 family)|nr:SgcJ/EcaC family oxidoreductase [Pyrinomonadaceae bacterium]
MQTRQAKVISSDEDAIRGLVDQWLTASEQGDLPTMLNLLADDVIFMVPNKGPFGKEEFSRSYESMKGAKMKTASDIQEIKISGDWAWMRNFLRVTFTDARGESSKHSGYVLTILNKRSDETWVIARDANLLTPEGNSK